MITHISQYWLVDDPHLVSLPLIAVINPYSHFKVYNYSWMLTFYSIHSLGNIVSYVYNKGSIAYD